MSRSSITYGLNAIKKKTRAHSDPEINRLINDVYEELNRINDSVNLQSGSYTASPGEGKDGDIRLYKGTGYDGSEGYFLQGKFNDGWGTVQLTLETKNPENTDVSDTIVTPILSAGNALITDINYSNLNTNLSVGFDSNKVAPGQWSGKALHDHWTNANDPGSDHHNDIHYPIGTTSSDLSTITPDASKSTGNASTKKAARIDHVHAISTAAPDDNSVSLSSSSEGSGNDFARAKHSHSLSQSITPTWSGKHIFDVGTGNVALDITGNVNISGILSVTYAATDTSAATLNNNVTLNTATQSYTTTIHGNTTIGDTSNSRTLDVWGKVSIKDADNAAAILEITGGDGSSNPAIYIKSDSAAIKLERVDNTNDIATLKIDDASNLNITAGTSSEGHIVLNPTGGKVLPHSSLLRDLGYYNRKWRSLYAGELIVENLVAQDIMATIGGRILVAPTSELTEDIDASATIVKIKHNNFHAGDFMYLASAPGGTAQFEFMEVKANTPSTSSPYLYNVNRDHDGGGANSWVAGDAVVNYGGEIGDGVIDITSTQTVFSHAGPTISIYSRSNKNTISGGSGDNTHTDYKRTVSLGNLNAVAGIGTDRWGLAIGNDVSLSPSDGTFKGLVADAVEGLKMYNTDIDLYDDVTVKASLGLDDNSDPELWLGNSTSDRVLNVRKVSGNYKVTLKVGALEILDGSDAVSFDNSSITWANAEGFSGFPDFLKSGSPSSDGVYISNTTVGFYDQSETGWPVVIHNDTDANVGKFYVGPAWNLSESIATAAGSSGYVHWDGSSMNVKGAINATSGSFADSVTIGSGSVAASVLVSNASDGDAAHTALNDDFEVGSGLTNTITLAGGSIKIPSTAGSIIYSDGANTGFAHASDGNDKFDTNNTVAGFKLGRDGDGFKFLIKNNKNDSSSSDQQYVKIDTSNSTDAITIKGNLYADRLANVTPKISDGTNFQNLTIIKSYQQGSTSIMTGQSLGDWASNRFRVEGIRNGALVELKVKAHPTTIGSAHYMRWCNPSIFYSRKDYGSNQIARASGLNGSPWHHPSLYVDRRYTGAQPQLRYWNQVGFHEREFGQHSLYQDEYSSNQVWFDIMAHSTHSDDAEQFSIKPENTNFGDLTSTSNPVFEISDSNFLWNRKCLTGASNPDISLFSNGCPIIFRERVPDSKPQGSYSGSYTATDATHGGVNLWDAKQFFLNNIFRVNTISNYGTNGITLKMHGSTTGTKFAFHGPAPLNPYGEASGDIYHSNPPPIYDYNNNAGNTSGANIIIQQHGCINTVGAGSDPKVDKIAMPYGADGHHWKYNESAKNSAYGSGIAPFMQATIQNWWSKIPQLFPELQIRSLYDSSPFFGHHPLDSNNIAMWDHEAFNHTYLFKVKWDERHPSASLAAKNGTLDFVFGTGFCPSDYPSIAPGEKSYDDGGDNWGANAEIGPLLKCIMHAKVWNQG